MDSLVSFSACQTMMGGAFLMALLIAAVVSEGLRAGLKIFLLMLLFMVVLILTGAVEVSISYCTVGSLRP